MKILAAGLLSAVSVSCAHAQAFKVPSKFEALAARASDHVEISLDGAMLRVAGAFLDEDGPDAAATKKLFSNLKGVHVHHAEFDEDSKGVSAEDLKALKEQLQGPGWVKVVSEENRREKELVEIYAKQEHGRPTGLVVLAAEERELTLVDIDGAIDPADLKLLSGHFGIPDGHGRVRSVSSIDVDDDDQADLDADDD